VGVNDFAPFHDDFGLQVAFDSGNRVDGNFSFATHATGCHFIRATRHVVSS
jgi:hypothetical protein